MGSGDNIEAGRVARAEGRTILWAQVPPGQPNFNGPAILIADVAQDAEDPDDYEDGESFVPSNRFDGIVGVGWSGGSASNFGGTPGGTGVIGRGGRNQGTGLLGLGGGTPGPGNGGAGGIGVHGLGGPQADFLTDPMTPPGAGLVGQGGRQSAENNRERLPHAAGVIGIGGGTDQGVDALQAHPLSETGGVGVYGKGADLTVNMVAPTDATGNTVPGDDVPSGPSAAGAGVLGRGGSPQSPRDPMGPGVIGLAGDLPIPAAAETRDVGVFGAGDTGVVGLGAAGMLGRSDNEGGIGVRGVATTDTGRGAMLQSGRAAQLLLVPHKSGMRMPDPVDVTATAIPGREESVRLPRDGRGGDLLVLMDDQRRCSLWFCVRSEEASPAQWAQVLVGAPFSGTG